MSGYNFNDRDHQAKQLSLINNSRHLFLEWIIYKIYLKVVTTSPEKKRGFCQNFK